MALNTQKFNALPKTLGVDVNNVDTTQKHELGLEVGDNLGNVFKYVKFTTVVADKEPVKWDANFLAVIAATTDRVQGYTNAGASTANPSFAFVQIEGIVLAAKEITTGVVTTDPLALIMAAGKLQKIPAATVTRGDLHCRAFALANEAANVADILLVRL